MSAVVAAEIEGRNRWTPCIGDGHHLAMRWIAGASLAVVACAATPRPLSAGETSPRGEDITGCDREERNPACGGLGYPDIALVVSAAVAVTLFVVGKLR